MMFFAESLSLIVFFIQSKFINSKEKQEIKNNTQKSTLTIICLICLCSSLDLCNTFIDNSIVIILMDNLLYNISYERKRNELNKTKVEGYDVFINTDNLLSWDTVAKNLGIGRNTLLKILREHKILQTDKYKYNDLKVIDNYSTDIK